MGAVAALQVVDLADPIEEAVRRSFSGATWVTALDVAAEAGPEVGLGSIEAVLARLVDEGSLVAKVVPVYDTSVISFRSRLAQHTCEMCSCHPDAGGIGAVVRLVVSAPLAPINALRSWL